MIICFACMKFSWVCQQRLATAEVVMRRCRVMMFEKLEVVVRLHEPLTGTQPLTTLA